ncbi:MAG: hypothetical protein EOM20_03265 [Spartobacteria bacterium]|nr:hypothetical protein [Spartobacteria bacterium]
MELNSATYDLMESAGDPLTIAAMLGYEELYDWQCQTLMDLFQPWSRVALVTPNESGKTSYIVTLAGICWMLRYPGSKVVSTAGAFRQVSDQLWPNVREIAGRYPDWKCNDEKLVIPSPRGIRPSEWTIFSTNDPNKAEGYHNQTISDENGQKFFAPLLYMIDEAKGVDDLIFFARDRCNPYAGLECSTPGEETGVFWERVMKHRGSKEYGEFKWRVHEVGWHDCPHLLRGGNYEMRRQQIDDWGEDHPVVQSMVYGRFYSLNTSRIFNMTHVDSCMSGTVPRFGKERRGAVDLAFGGKDETVFGVRDGNTMTAMECLREKDNSKQIGKLIRLFERHNLRPHEITIDAGGPGGKVVADELENRGWRGLYRYQWGAKAGDVRMYASRGAEHYYKLSRLCNKKSVGLISDNVLREQLRQRSYLVSPRGQVKIELKDVLRNKGQDSPDRGDMVVMLYSDMTEPTGSMEQVGGSRLYEKWLKQAGGMADKGYAGMRLDT